MKRIFNYMLAFLLVSMVGVSCDDNENWKIITAVQQGTYVTGSATIYSAAATSSQFVTAALDGTPAEGTSVSNIYTWLKASGEFTILKADAEGNQVIYGKGASVATTPFETVTLAADGTPFKVTADGLYHLILNNADNQLTIVPATFGIIGDATPNLWNGETAMSAAAYNEDQTVTFFMKDQTLDKKEMKFRYSGNWGVDIPYAGGTVKVHTNMGLKADGAGNITAAFSDCKGSGANFKVDKKGTYDITLKLDLRTGAFTAKALLTGEDTSSAELPEKMFIIGTPNGWDWAKSFEMTPVHSHDGWFWTIKYFEQNAEIKFNNTMAWNGDEFAAGSADPYGYGEVPVGGNNLKVKDAGFYQVVIKTSLSADKKSVEKKIFLVKPAVYLINETAPNPAWGVHAENLFTLTGDKYVSPATKADGKLRMFALVDGADPWQSEFLIYDGNIKFRGTAGDLADVPVKAGQVVTLDFKTNTGTIK